MLDIRTRPNTWRYSKMDIKPSAQVKKSLFADESEEAHESHQETLNRELDSIIRQNSDKWNFDFAHNKPKPGNYQWELNANIIRDVDYMRAGESLDKTSTPEISPSSPTKRSQDKTSDLTMAYSPSSQSSIHDFFPKRKRSSPSTAEIKLHKRSKSESPLRTKELTKPVVARSLDSLFKPIANPHSQ